MIKLNKMVEKDKKAILIQYEVYTFYNIWRQVPINFEHFSCKCL